MPLIRGNSRFAKGILRRDDAHRRNQADARHLLKMHMLNAPNLPKKASLAAYRPAIFDQGNTGTCFAHALSFAAKQAADSSGFVLPFLPSPDVLSKIIRAYARSLAGIPNTTPLTDDGAIAADTMAAPGTWGVCPMKPRVQGRNSDVDENRVNDEPDFLHIETSGQKLITGEYRLDETASDFIQLAKATIALQRVPIILTFFCDLAYEEWEPGKSFIGAPDMTDPEGGGHMVVADGYEDLADGTTVFDTVSSWSDQVGDGGVFRVSTDWMNNVWDAYPMTLRSPQ